MSWFLLAMRRYAQFDGRSQRAEYWFFILFYFIIIVALSVVDVALGWYSNDMGVLGAIALLVFLMPSISVGVRRLHDIGRTGWWMLFGLIPIIGAVVLFVFAVMDSEPEQNKYGPNPKNPSV